MKTRILNSTLLLFIAYYIVNFTYIISQFIILKFLGLNKVVMYFFYNVYEMREDSWWSRAKVFLILGGGLLCVFILLFLVIVAFINLSRKKYKKFVLYNWIIIIGSSFLLSELFSPAIYTVSAPFYYVLRWMYIEDGGGGMYVLALLTIPFIPFVSYFTSKNFLKMANSTRWLKTKEVRLKFFTYIAIIPFVIFLVVMSVFLFFTYSYPREEIMAREGVRFMFIGAILLFGYFFNNNKNYLSIQKSNNMHEMNFSHTLFYIVFILVVYVLLWFN